MTTYSTTGFVSYFPSAGGSGPVGVAADVEFALIVPDSTKTLSYTTVQPPDAGFPMLADVFVKDGIALIGGQRFDAEDMAVLDVTWAFNGASGTTTFLVFYFEDAAAGGVDPGGLEDAVADAMFPIGGDTLPAISTLADAQAFFDGIGAEIQPSGALGPERDIALSSLFPEVSEDDEIHGTDGNDTLRGGAGDDQLFGGLGNDRLVGGAGQDLLMGGDGNDTLNPGDNESWDTIATGRGRDKVVFSNLSDGYAGLGHWDLNKGIKVTIDGNANTGVIRKGKGNGVTKLIDVENPMLATESGFGGLGIEGTGKRDVFNVTVTDGGWAQLSGLGGNDTFNIGASEGYLRLNYRGAESGVTADLGMGTVSDDGNGGSDVITGSGQVNEIRTGMFDDHVTGSDKGESFILMAGNDTVEGGGGFDRLRYDRPQVEDVTVDLARGEASGVWRGEDFAHSISGIEWVSGSNEGSDTLLGDSSKNRLDGRGGNDVLKGRGGHDTLNGEEGRDRLFGGGGRDTLDGGAGNDFLSGGKGRDVFVFSEGHDRINGLGRSDDIDLSQADGIRSFRDLRNNHLEERNGNVVISDDDGNTLTLLNRGISDLSADDFLFCSDLISSCRQERSAIWPGALFSGWVPFSLKMALAGDRLLAAVRRLASLFAAVLHSRLPMAFAAARTARLSSGSLSCSKR
ncbi:calcium-binding protein [Leisingera sp. ANG-M1]|uniref:calcium-binding protein n=1 Tax=Leisingera sp. ANG-M1 TaxID=1577895 RepID=UPI00187C2E5D|nr:calcium-binding protein [Leisingera sp. ANG-M1]